MSLWLGCFGEKKYLKIRKIHHKPLKVVFNIKRDHDEFLRDNNGSSVHQRHLRVLTCEVFKSLNNLNLELIWSYFVFKNMTYNIRNGPLLRLPATKSTSYGINLVLFRACLLWNSVSHESIIQLKPKIEDFGNIDCSCILRGRIVQE